MIRKLAILGSTAALLATSVTPIFGFMGGGMGGYNMGSGESENKAYVTTWSENVASTGGNSQNDGNVVTNSNYVLGLNLGYGSGDRTINTGAATANSDTRVVVNQKIRGNGNNSSPGLLGLIFPQGSQDNESKNKAVVTTGSKNIAETGFNTQDNYNGVDESCGVIVGNVGLSGGARSITTGAASATTNTTVRVGSRINTSSSLSN